MGTERIYGTSPPPTVHTTGLRPIGLIGKMFHKLILYLLFIIVCLLLSSLQEYKRFNSMMNMDARNKKISEDNT